MKITILGATGRVGRQLVQYALADGHSVTALVRSPKEIERKQNLTIIQGDVRNENSVSKALRDADLVMSALGTDGTTVLSESIPYIVQAMQEQHIKRIVTIGTAGILKSRTDSNILRYLSKDSRRRSTIAAKEHEKVYEILKETTLDWTIVCPTYLRNGTATKTYRVEKDLLPLGGTEISTGDTAYFAYHELFASAYAKSRVGIAY